MMAGVQIKNLGGRLIGYKLGSEKPILANIVSLKVVFFIKDIVLYFAKMFIYI